jgi:hypothetical protein
MTLCPYSSDELKQLHRILDQIVEEMRDAHPGIDIDDIIERMFDAADQGERDPAKLRAAVLQRARAA